MRAIIFASVALLASPVPFAARAGEQKPSCITGLCHTRTGKGQYRHEALEDKDCTDCHVVKEGSSSDCEGGFGFEPIDQPAICYECHDQFEYPHMHSAVREVGCTGCHLPHSADNELLLRSTRPEELCGECHDVTPADAKSKHRPVYEKNCLSCHLPHGSENENLLQKPMPRLCSDCHRLEEWKNPQKTPYAHYPFAAGWCTGCHNVHYAQRPKLLRGGQPELCTSCHGPLSKGPHRSVLSVDLKKENVHEAMDEQGCLTCHKPHASANPGLLVRPNGGALCFECHDEFDQPFKHSAVALGRCSRCHDPHSSSNKGLVVATGSQLCFRCHQNDLAGRHSQHKPAAGGDCTTCHDPHGSDSYFSLKGGTGSKLCLRCHGPEGESSLKISLDGNVHEIIDRLGCTACHDPHGSDYSRLLVAPVNRLCSGCHRDEAGGDHIAFGFQGKTHPVEGVNVPGGNGEQISCISCHDPHSSKNPKLWRWGKKKLELCSHCHPSLGQETKQLPEASEVKK